MKDLECKSKDEIDELIFYKTTIIRSELNKIGIYMGQPIMLDIISKNPGFTQKKLADIARIKPSTVNVMLGRMAKNGLVEIKKDENNSKNSQVFITEKGSELGSKCSKCKKDLDNLIYDNLTDQEKTELKRILTKINNNLREKLKEEGVLNNENA